jgi:two-component system cell cycle response regulator
MAYTDALTGVYNRRYMHSHLDRKIMEITEAGKPVSVMMFDIDHFKPINDTYGHAAGDEVLKQLAARVADNVRDFDMVARYGGEEFVVIMPTTPPEAAFMVAERVRNRIAGAPFPIPGQEEPLEVTVSIGVATTTDPAEEAASLVARADASLYEAKRTGRNRSCSAELTDPSIGEPAAAAGG